MSFMHLNERIALMRLRTGISDPYVGTLTWGQSLTPGTDYMGITNPIGVPAKKGDPQG